MYKLVENVAEKLDAIIDVTNKHETRLTVVEYEVDNIHEKLDKIYANINKLLWVVIGTIIVYLINKLLKGGV